ncbi:putative proliferating cell nuclear antigen, PCNA [Rosa chinensis]|uniref:Putative proliferating cell nuclear antigen, PCNA n=1 Tax=Rosa chinensis TaxID=74649 RepID=A0A2P6SJW3_ROSCH|nr:putative proliferating cell nuclear antigen, PCNA [Rosa chinensis]
MKVYGINYCSRTELVGCWPTELFDCSPTELCLQALDPSYLSLVALRLRPDAFKHYQCDRPISLGIVLPSMAKILNFAVNDDDVTIRLTMVIIVNNSIGCIASVDDKPEEEEEEEEEVTVIEMNEPVSIEYQLSCLKPFTEASPLSNTFRINLSRQLPVVVDYKIAKTSYFRFYLTPIVKDEDGRRP